MKSIDNLELVKKKKFNFVLQIFTKMLNLMNYQWEEKRHFITIQSTPDILKTHFCCATVINKLGDDLKIVLQLFHYFILNKGMKKQDNQGNI